MMIDPSTVRSGRKRQRRSVAVAALTAIGLLAATACASTSTSSASGAATPGTQASTSNNLTTEDDSIVDGGTLVVGVAQETNGWNPHVNQWAQWGSVVASSVLEPLAVRDDKSVPQPWLATSWTPNETFDVWTIELRTDVLFQDGEPFDAAAVKMNIDDALKAPLSSLPLAGLFKNVSVVGPHTVKVELNSSWSSFPSSFLASQTGIMMAPAMLKSEDSGQRHPIGTGPFTFAEWTPDSNFRATKNPTYWRKDEPHLDSIEFRVIADPRSQVNAFKANDIDMFFTTDAAAAIDLGASNKVVRNWASEPTMLMTNTLDTIGGQPNALSNEHARTALALATDRKSIAALIGEGVGTPTSPFSPENPWGQPEDANGYPAFDIDKAKAEVDAYKKESNSDQLRVKLVGLADSQSSLILQALQQQWRAVGIEATIDTVESATYIQRMVVGNYQLALFPIYTSPEPDLNYFFWTSKNANGEGKISINFSQYKSAAIDADLKTGRESPDPAVRKQAYSDLVKQINAAAINIWLYWTPYSVIAAPRVHGLKAVAAVPFANFEPKTFFGQLSIVPR